ncbi:MAG: beta strand repeat-containing protein [Planctomycetota bacterium]
MSAALLVNTALADDTWTGAVSSDWSVAGNWNGGNPPSLATDVATFPVAATNLTNVPSTLRQIEISAAVAVSIQSLASGNELTLSNGGVVFLAAGSFSVGAGITLTITNPSNGSNLPAVTLITGSSMTVAGRLNVGTIGSTAMQITGQSASTLTVGSFGAGAVSFICIGAPGSSATMNVGAGIFMLGDNAELDGSSFLNASQTFWHLNLTGDIAAGAFTNCLTWFDYFDIEITGNVAMTGTGADPFSSTINEIGLGKLIVGAGETFSIDQSVIAAGGTAWLYEFDNAGTINLRDQGVVMSGSRQNAVTAIWNNHAGATFTVNGNVTTKTADAVAGSNCRIEGEVTIGGTVTVTSFPVLVANGASLTLNGAVVVNTAGKLGAVEDGAADTGAAFLYTNASASFQTAASFITGEGFFYFAGDIDLGGSTNTSNVTLPPTNGANNVIPQIHLTGTTQAFQTDATGVGSIFTLTSVAAGTRVTHTGNLTLLGTFDTSGATGATPFSVWTTTTVDTTTYFGAAAFGSTVVIVMGDGDIGFDAAVARQVDNGNANESNEIVLTRASGKVGRFIAHFFSVHGDFVDNAVGNPETNAARFYAQNAHFVMGDGTDGGFICADGAGAFEANGSSVNLDDCTIELMANATWRIGSSGAPTGTDAAAECNLTGCTTVPGAGSTIDVRGDVTFVALDSTFNGSGAWTFNAVFSSEQTILANCTVQGGTAGGLTMKLFSSRVIVTGTTFSNCDASGVQISGLIAALNDNTFQSGTATGAHITLSGITNSVDLPLTNNVFDNSVGVLSLGAGGLFVSGTGPFIFTNASDDFGLAAYNITAVNAELDADSDGFGAGEVRWLMAGSLLAIADKNASISAGITDSNEHKVLDFTAAATLANATIASIAVLFDAGGQLDPDTDITEVHLYRDGNDDGIGTPLEELANVAPSGGIASFAALGMAINSGNTARLLVTIKFGTPGKYGDVTALILPNTIIPATTTVITGLPLVNRSIHFSGPATQLSFITQPTGDKSNEYLDQQPVIELRDANGKRVWADSSTQISASLSTAPSGATLGGTKTVTAVSGWLTFTDLTVSAVGSYVLTFDDGIVNLTIDSNLFVIVGVGTAPPGGGGGGGGNGKGGCVAGAASEPASGGLLLLVLLALMAVRRLNG